MAKAIFSADSARCPNPHPPLITPTRPSRRDMTARSYVRVSAQG